MKGAGGCTFLYGRLYSLEDVKTELVAAFGVLNPNEGCRRLHILVGKIV